MTFLLCSRYLLVPRLTLSLSGPYSFCEKIVYRTSFLFSIRPASPSCLSSEAEGERDIWRTEKHGVTEGELCLGSSRASLVALPPVGEAVRLPGCRHSSLTVSSCSMLSATRIHLDHGCFSIRAGSQMEVRGVIQHWG